MSTLYEKIYIEAFSRRTLVAIGCFMASYYVLFGALFALGRKTDWLYSGFYLHRGLFALPFIAVLLARLRLLIGTVKILDPP